MHRRLKVARVYKTITRLKDLVNRLKKMAKAWGTGVAECLVYLLYFKIS